MFERSTLRLRLIPLPPASVRRLLEGWPALQDHLQLARSPVEVPETLREEFQQALPLILKAVEDHPADYRWHTAWIIVRQEDRRIVGMSGFAGRPDAQGAAFLGYWIDPRHQRCGYMTEALGGLAAWAWEHPETRSLRATVPPGGAASGRVLLKNGFQPAGESNGMPLWVRERPAGVS